MRATSIYSVECVCGYHIESETTELVCPGCQRLVVIEWPAEPDITEPPQQRTLPIAA